MLPSGLPVVRWRVASVVRDAGALRLERSSLIRFLASGSKNARRISLNRAAIQRYKIEQVLECGMELKGTEVKSLRAGNCDISAAVAIVREKELFLRQCTIPEYDGGRIGRHGPDRERRLLAHRREIQQMEKFLSDPNHTLIPTKVYFNDNGIAKIELGYCLGRRQSDTRENEKDKMHSKAARSARSF